jgi:hypothetical protein
MVRQKRANSSHFSVERVRKKFVLQNPLVTNLQPKKTVGITKTPSVARASGKERVALESANFAHIEAYLRNPKNNVRNRAAQLEYLAELRRKYARLANGKK